jgi:PAS domain S-box-containing protein
MKILIAEDSLVSRLRLERTLTKMGFDVIATSNGLDALEALKQPEPPPLAIVDWNMPGMDGLDLCREVRQTACMASTYLMLLTANSRKEDLIAGLEAGADDYIVKPYDNEELRARLQVGVRIVELQQSLADNVRSLQATNESLVQLASIVESSGDAIIGQTLDGTIASWNGGAQRAYGYSAEEVKGRAFSLLISPDRYEEESRARESIGRGESMFNYETVRVRSDGKRIDVSVTISPIKDLAGNTTGIAAIERDITERRILESQLRQSQKLESIGQLAAGIAHEINTPMQYVGDNIRFLQDAFRDLSDVLEPYAALADAFRAHGAPPELIADVEAKIEQADVDYLMEEIPRAIQQSLEGTERVTTIVQSMKNFAHPSGSERLAVDLNKAIESTITVASNEWKYIADLKTNFDEALPPVSCFLGEFNQVILNLVVNASHAIAAVVGDGSEGKGTITITTCREGDWARIDIADTGAGIPEQHRTRIFDPFFTTKEVGKGTGQGLAISHSVVVEKHGGALRFDTEDGKGTTFTILLPIQGAS